MGIAFTIAGVCDGLRFLISSCFISLCRLKLLDDKYRTQRANTELRIALGLVYVNDGVESISFRLESSTGVSRYR